MISFKMFAGTNIGLRDNNEDNFLVCPNLTLNEWIVPDNSQELPLGKNGCLMVVADGMGGQNAGEVASEIAVQTVKEMFAPKNLPKDVLMKPDSIKNYLKNVISEADIRIKERGKKDKSAAGLGSTIVIVWLVGEKAYVAWLGDSRAYSFIRNQGIGRISKDHSYVQQLVDAGMISDEDAMTHPQSNIITRSLGDTTQKAKPDVMEYTVENDEIILLCSDGLCGVCKDEFIGGILDEDFDNLQKCKEKLTTAALAAGGSDNITVALLRIKKNATSGDDAKTDKEEINDKRRNNKNIILWAAISLIIILAVFCIKPIFHGCTEEKDVTDTTKYTLFFAKLTNNNEVYLTKDTIIRYYIKPHNLGFEFNLDKSIIKQRDDSTFVLFHDKAKDGNLLIEGVKIINLKDTVKVCGVLRIIKNEGAFEEEPVTKKLVIKNNKIPNNEEHVEEERKDTITLTPASKDVKNNAVTKSDQKDSINLQNKDSLDNTN